MPRKPDPDLEDRILKAAHALWRQGGDKALTLRAVARGAKTNTPAVYRRFKNRDDLIDGLLLRFVGRIREQLDAETCIEDAVDGYIDLALREPHEYELFYRLGYKMNPPSRGGRPRPLRESRPNFALLEKRLAQRLGGSPEDHTRLALVLWALGHGTASALLSKNLPEGHCADMRAACRTAVEVLLDGSAKFPRGAAGRA